MVYILSLNAQMPAPEQLLSQGAVSYSRSQYEKAADYLYQFVEVDPEHIAARKLLAATLLQLQQYEQALEVLLALPARLWQDDEQYQALTAQANLLKGDDISAFQRLRQLAKNNKEPVSSLLTFYIKNDESDGTVVLVELESSLPSQAVIKLFEQLQQGQYKQALLNVDGLLNQNRRSALNNHLAALVHVALNNSVRAYEFWREALRLGKPPLLSTLLALAEYSAQLGDTERAEQLYVQAVEQAPEHPVVLEAYAKHLSVQGQLEQALDLFIHVWEQSGQISSAVALIELLIQRQDYPAALHYAKALKARYPEQADSLLQLGLTALMNDELGLARQQFTDLSALRLQAAEPWYLLATVSIRAQDYPTALSHLDRAIELENDYLPARLLRAELFLLGRNYAQALAEVKQIQQQDTSAVAYKLEGDIHMAQKNYPAAITAYNTAHQHSPSVQTTLLLNHAQRSAGKTQAAITTLRDWLWLIPESSTVRLQLAMQLEQDGQLAAAQQEYEAVLAVQPENLIVLNNLAWLLRDSDPKRALKLAETALELGGERPEILDTAGWLLANSGQHERGLRLLQQAVLLAPHLPSIRYHQALAYEHAQRYSEALEVLAEVSIEALDAELRAQVTELHQRLKTKTVID